MGLTLTFSLPQAFLTPLCLLPQGSLSCHAPKDQAYSQILEHVYSQLSNVHWVHPDITAPPFRSFHGRNEAIGIWSGNLPFIRKKHTVDALNFSTPVQSLTSEPLYLELRKHTIHFWSSQSVILVGYVYQWDTKSDGTDAGGRAGKQENKNQRVADNNWSI